MENMLIEQSQLHHRGVPPFCVLLVSSTIGYPCLLTFVYCLGTQASWVCWSFNWLCACCG